MDSYEADKLMFIYSMTLGFALLHVNHWVQSFFYQPTNLNSS